MQKLFRALVVTLAVLAFAACAQKPTPAPTVTPVPSRPASTATPVPSATPEASATPVPTATLIPTLTPFPTLAELAPKATFTKVGNVAQLSGEHGVSGKAVVAGLQTLIIQGFNFDGKGPKADIRIVKGEDHAQPAAILLELDQQPYDNRLLLMNIPSSAEPGSADSIAVYCPETGETYAVAVFD